MKCNYIQRTNINGTKSIPRASSSRDEGHYTTESHKSPTIKVHTTNTWSQNRSIYKAEANKTLPKNEKTEKQPPIKRRGGIPRKSAK